MLHKTFVTLSLALIFCTFVKADEIDQLKEQLQQQKSRIEDLRVRLDEMAADQAEATALNVYWDNGLRFETEDGNFKLKIGGRIMFDWTYVSEDDGLQADVGDQEDGTEIRRGRFYISGDIYDNISYKLQVDFAGSGTDFKDAYISFKDFPLGTLKVGNFKEPFSLNELTSSKYITFMERGLPNALVPGRNVGFMLSGTAANERMTWAAGVFRDTDEDDLESSADGGHNFTARLTALPFYCDQGDSLLHLGAAYSHRNPDDTASVDARPEAHLLDKFIDTGDFSADQADLVGLEAAWVNGPLSVQGEYIMSDFNGTNGGPDVDFDGYYLYGSYFLTGEHRVYKKSAGAFSRVKPAKNFGQEDGIGAWELAARYSSLDLDDAIVTGGELNNITAGLNWYLNPNMRIMWNYVHADKDNTGQADIAMMRFQVDF